MLVPKNSTFVAKKAKMFEEERSVAEKAPVDGIQINDLNLNESKKKESKWFQHAILADILSNLITLKMPSVVKDDSSYLKELKALNAF